MKVQSCVLIHFYFVVNILSITKRIDMLSIDHY